MKNPSSLPYISRIFTDFGYEYRFIAIFLRFFPATFRSRKRPCEVQEYLKGRVSLERIGMSVKYEMSPQPVTHTHTHMVSYICMYLCHCSLTCECRAFSPPIFPRKRTLSLLQLVLCFRERSMGSCIGGTRLTMRED